MMSKNLSATVKIQPDVREENEEEEKFRAEAYFPWNENFMWNYSLIKEFFSLVEDKRWVVPVIHGYIN
jgi:hypothetical protein